MDPFIEIFVKGIILLAPEGINVSISLLSEQKKSFIDQLNNLFNTAKIAF